MVRWILLLVIGLSGNSLWAGELHLEYADFYSHLRKLNGEELQSLQFAFGFLHVQSKDLCRVSSVLIDTDKKDIDVPVQSNRRFVLPNEKALKMAKARLLVKLEEPQNQCDLSVLLEVKPELFAEPVNASQLLSYFHSFEAFFDKMGGFLSFMMPSPEGLQITFNDPTTVPKAFSASAKLVGEHWQIKQEDIERLLDTKLSGIKQITALMPN
ncbi:DUF2987 domain-containing protein [Planctobacterium marinum]|uniref:DUF2987 domain-containing protein n=1 Tax=Planctobacterium marinum TaxID=1631968 RepID=A0AA48HGJ6_9ALTE|nr:hypothetical protein MACH26_20540 [Planctobacterium marinum]